MGKRDTLYRRLFQHPRLLRDLLACVMDEQFLLSCDWESLQPLDSAYVGERLEQRMGDGAWRIPYRAADKDLYILLMLENQSRPDRYMALRTAAYAALLYQSLLRGKLADLPLPPILPVVLYSGLRRWTASRDMAGLVDGRAPDLRDYQLGIRYLLIDEAGLLKSGGLPDRNLAALLFRLEHSGSIEQIPELLHTLRHVLKGPAFAELDRSFTAYIQYLVLSRAQPLQPLPSVTNLEELAMLISEKPGMWARQWKSQGHQEGRQEGAADVLFTLLSAKFGSLPDWVRMRLGEASETDLKEWTVRVLDASSLSDVFDGPPS